MPFSRTPLQQDRLLRALLPVLLLAGCASAPPPAVPATVPATPPVASTPRPEARPTASASSAVSAEVKAEAAAVAAPGQSPVLRPTEGNVALLAYADRLRSVSAGELSAEIARLGEMTESQRTPFHDMQLAVALSQTRSPQDTQRSQALLQRLTNNSSEDARRLHPLARLMAARLNEQRRVEDQLERQNQQLRDSQRRIDQLNDRLEAVRAIERSLTRSGGNGGSPAPATTAKP